MFSMVLLPIILKLYGRISQLKLKRELCNDNAHPNKEEEKNDQREEKEEEEEEEEQ